MSANRILPIKLVLFAAVVLTGLVARPVRAGVVVFPDPGLQQAVRDALGSPPGDITDTQMLTLTNLDATARGITDTTGLEAALNLQYLVLNGNPVTNYSGVAGLTNLTRLDFVSGSVSNISFLAGLTRLEMLYLYDNQIRNAAPLAGLTGLKLLQLDWNAITNPGVISGLTNLVELDLAGNSIASIAFLTPLARLERLSLYLNQVGDISPLAGLTALRSVGLGWNPVTNHPVLAGLPNLEAAALNGNGLSNLNFLATMTTLRELYLDYNPLGDVSVITNLAALELLNLGENGLPSLPDLSPLTALRWLAVAGNTLSNLDFIGPLAALEELHLQRNQIQDLSPLTLHPGLRHLLLSGNPVTNLAVVSGLTNLYSISLAELGISDLAFLAPLTSLNFIELDDNYVTDLSPLTNLPYLGRLLVERNELEVIDPLLSMSWLWEVNLVGNYLDTNTSSAAWQVITALQSRGVNISYDPQRWRPIILIQPANRSALTGSTVEFYANAVGSDEAQGYQWVKDGVDLVNDGRITGAQWRTLSISDVSEADAGFYRVRVWDSGGTTNSRWVELKIITSVAFADPNLEQAVRLQLGIPTDPLTPADLSGMTYLDASYRNITNLSGLETAVDLGELDLSGNPAIRSFQPATYLQLWGLHLNDCQMDDLGWVVGMPALYSLFLADNFVEDLSPLRQITGMSELDLRGNQLQDITPLFDLSNLGWLDVRDNRLNTNETSAAWRVITNALDRGAWVEFDPQRGAPIPPTIFTQPGNAYVSPGNNAIFEVSAGGSAGSLQFQWQKNGVNIVDDGRIYGRDFYTLHIDNVGPGDDGLYRVRIWDDAGMIYSRAAELRVVGSVVFADPKLEAAVRVELGIPADPLTLGDMASLTSLALFSRGITNLAGLEYAVNLTYLNLNENPGLVGCGALSGLGSLRELYLNNCGLTDLLFLAGLSHLWNLELGSNAIEDVRPLLGLTELWRLRLDYNPLTNQVELASLTGLGELGLPGTGLSNLAFVSGMMSLYGLDFWDNRVSDLGPLAGHTNLGWLFGGYNTITNPGTLVGDYNLSSLYLYGNSFSNLEFVAGMTNLHWLGLDQNPITDLAPLAGLTNLFALGLGYITAPAAQFNVLSSLTNLTSVSCSGDGLSNLDFLLPLPGLQEISAGDNHLYSLPNHPHLKGLRFLSLDGNPLSNLGFLSGMTNLRSLYVSRTAISDLTPLAAFPDLTDLGVAQLGLRDLSPLAGMQLHWLTISDNNVQDIHVLGGMTNLNYVDLRQNLLDTTPGCPAMVIVGLLQARRTTVDYLPQKSVPFTTYLANPDDLAAFASGATVGVTARVFSGTSPYTVSFYTNGILAATQVGVGSQPEFVLPLAGLADGSYRIHARAEDSAASTAYSATNTFSIGVVVNHSPIVPDLLAATVVNVGMVVSLDKLLRRASDQDGDTLSVASVTLATTNGGSAVLTSTNTIYYEPVADSTNADRITFTITDGHGGAADGHVLVTVYPTNFLRNNLVTQSVSGGQDHVTWAGIPGLEYTIEYATNLAPPVTWVKVENKSADARGHIIMTPQTTAGSRFYRTKHPSY
jgi:internalin A